MVVKHMHQYPHGKQRNLSTYVHRCTKVLMLAFSMLPYDSDCAGIPAKSMCRRHRFQRASIFFCSIFLFDIYACYYFFVFLFALLIAALMLCRVKSNLYISSFNILVDLSLVIHLLGLGDCPAISSVRMTSLFNEYAVHHSSSDGVLVQLPGSGGFGRITKETLGGDALAERLLRSFASRSHVPALMQRGRDAQGYRLLTIDLREGWSELHSYPLRCVTY